MITLHDFSIGFGRRELLSHVSTSFSDGCLTALLGRNGTGKSTMLRAIGRLNTAYTGTVACGFEDDAGAAEFCNLFVGDGALVEGNADEVLFSRFYAFGNSGLNFIGFTKAPAYDALAVANNYDCGEGEGATAFGYFGNAVNGNETILKFDVVGGFYAILIVSHGLVL